MSALRASRPSPVFVLAVLALVAAFAGTAIAGPDALGRAISKSKVTKIAKQQIEKAEAGLSVAEAKKTGDADNLGGQPPSAYASSSAVRFVKINADGTIDPALSKGVTQVNVTTDGTGGYCISGLTPPPLNAQASIDESAPFGAQVYVQVNSTVKCVGKQVWISTFNSANAGLNATTFVALFG